MLAVARWMARSAFGIGLAIGLVFNLGLIPALTSANATAPCVDVSSIEPSVQPFLDLQCDVHASLFNDGSEAGAAYSFGDRDSTTPGKYSGTEWSGRSVTFDVARVVSLNLKVGLPSLHERGAIARLVWGRLHGPAGNAAVFGLFVYPKGLSDDNQFLFIAMSRLSDAELAAMESVSRIEAGVRVLDVATFKSVPLNNFGRASAVSSSPEDLASLYGSHVNSPGTPGASSVDGSCVQQAYRNYNIDLEAAEATLSMCSMAALGAAQVALAACVASTFFTPVSVFGAMICAAVVAAGLAVAITACAGSYYIASDTARQHLIAALAACGVTVYEQ